MPMAVERLSPGDLLMLRASEVWPQEIGALASLEGGPLFDAADQFRIEQLRERIASRLHLVTRFRQVVRDPSPPFGGPVWVDVGRFDIAEHVRVMRLEGPCDDAGLLDAAETLRRARLDPSRPGWEMWFLIGTAHDRVGLFVKIHHAVADGLAAMTIIGALLDPGADAPMQPARVWRPHAPPTRPALLADSLQRYFRAWADTIGALVRPRVTWSRLHAAIPALHELLVDDPPPETSLGRLVGADRTLAVVRAHLADLRSIARAHDATVNDVLLAATAGGLRALLVGRGEPVDGVTVPIYVPVSLRRRWHGAVQGNRVAQMAVPLPLGTADPAVRLAAIAAVTAERKTLDRSAVGKLFRSGLMTRLMLKAVNRQRVHACSANIPGPRRPLYLAGARVLEVMPVLPLIGRVALGVGAISYAGDFTIGVTADRDAFPDLEVLVSGIHDELAELRGSRSGGYGRSQPTTANARPRTQSDAVGSPLPYEPKTLSTSRLNSGRLREAGMPASKTASSDR